VSTSVLHAGVENGERKSCCSLPEFSRQPSRRMGQLVPALHPISPTLSGREGRM